MIARLAPGPRALTSRLLRRLRTIYYRTAYGWQYPSKAKVEEWLFAWETADGRGDVPKDKDSWDDQYSRGGWDYLSSLSERSHYSVIVGYGSYLKADASILDVGCGHGVLHDCWLPLGYRRYVGVDVSDVAVNALRQRDLPAASFVAADAETYEPTEQFDVVVFNESITYFTDPSGGFTKYVAALAPDGIVIVSCHLRSARARAILKDLKQTWPVLDETEVRQGDNSWQCVVFKPLR